jgi:hypothetical protein
VNLFGGFFKKKIEHLHGPKNIVYGKDELIVTCLVKNGEFFINSFIEHYFSLGVKHIILLDNGSDDNTITIAKKYNNVTILNTKLLYKKYKWKLKRYLVENFSQNRWNLCADIDEFFDYPYSDKINLSTFLQYLNIHKYTSVVAQMLDMFSDNPMSKLKPTDNSLGAKYPYYDISKLEAVPGKYGFEVQNPKIKVFTGGIHKTIFGIDDDTLSLTKEPLLFINKNIKTTFVDAHHHLGTKIADITGVLYHYRFVKGFHKKMQHMIDAGGYWDHFNYKIYKKTLTQNPNVNLKRETAKKLNNVNELIKSGYLITSKKYIEWVKQNNGNA